MYLAPRTVQRVAKECYGKKLSMKVATAISLRTAAIVEELEQVLLESDDELGELAFTFSPKLGE